MSQQSLTKNNTHNIVVQHSCFACLTGSDASKRDCALRQMLADGVAEDGLRALLPSFKTAH